MLDNTILLKKIQRVQNDILRIKKSLEYAKKKGEDVKKMLYTHSDGEVTESGITMQERLEYLEKQISFWDTIHV